MKYRKKPVVIEAIQWTRDNYEEVLEFTNESCSSIFCEYLEVGKRYHYIYINTLEGTMKAEVGDYIIKGIKGEFYPCRKDIFEETYEKVEDD